MKQRAKFWIFFFLSALWAGMIFGRSMQPAVVSDQESGSVLSWVQVLFPGMTMYVIRKLAHLGEFAVLGWLVLMARRNPERRNISLPLLVCVLCALTDETIQLFVEGRSGQVQDVWIDLAGIFTAALVVSAARWLRGRLKMARRGEAEISQK